MYKHAQKTNTRSRVVVTLEEKGKGLGLRQEYTRPFNCISNV